MLSFGRKKCFLILMVALSGFIASRAILPVRSRSVEVLSSDPLIASLAEFRSSVRDVCLLAAEHYWHEGQWYRLPFLYEIALRMSPEDRESWQLLGWFYAFNWAEASVDPQKRRQIIFRGIKTLRDGLRYHSGRYELYFDLAWIYYKQLEDYDKTLQYLNLASRYEHPVAVERLEALAFAHSGKPEKAIDVWQEFLQRNPENKIAREEYEKIKKEYLGWVHG